MNQVESTQVMGEPAVKLIKAIMSVLLVVALVVPSAGISLAKDSHSVDDGCPHCLIIQEDASCCEDSCCESEAPEEPVEPCDGNDCQCPECPGPLPAAAPLNGVLFSQSLRFLPFGRSPLTPGAGPEWRSWNEPPAPPPPRAV